MVNVAFHRIVIFLLVVQAHKLSSFQCTFQKNERIQAKRIVDEHPLFTLNDSRTIRHLHMNISKGFERGSLSGLESSNSPDNKINNKCHLQQKRQARVISQNIVTNIIVLKLINSNSIRSKSTNATHATACHGAHDSHC